MLRKKRMFLLILFVILVGNLIFELQYAHKEENEPNTNIETKDWSSSDSSKTVENYSDDEINDVQDVDNDVKNEATDGNLKKESRGRSKTTPNLKSQHKKVEQKKNKKGK